MVLNIETVIDIERIRKAILNNEKFKIGEIKPIIYTIKLDGGRFRNYDTSIIDADIAKIVISHQTNYTKLLNELERNFKIQFSDEEKVLKFKLQDGCLEMISDVFKLDGLKNMESKHLMFVILGISLMWFTHSAFTTSVNEDITKVKEATKVKLAELDRADKKEERETYQKMVDKILDTNKALALNKNIQNAINKPKHDTIAILKNGETVNIDTATLTKANEASYEYIKPTVDDIEEDPIEGVYTLEYYNFVKDGKLFKIQGIAPLASSATISAQKRMRLMTKAETQQQVKLKIKIVKDGVTKQAKEAYILDYIE